MHRDAQVSPVNRNSSLLFADDIRHFIWDRSSDDNNVELDLAFSDEEIHNAKRYCAMSYNQMPPQVNFIDPSCMPNTMTMIHGTIYHLLLSKYHQTSRNDITYTAGGVTTEVTKTLISHLKEQIKFHKEEFMNLAKQEKILVNLHSAFGKFG